MTKKLKFPVLLLTAAMLLTACGRSAMLTQESALSTAGSTSSSEQTEEEAAQTTTGDSTEQENTPSTPPPGETVYVSYIAVGHGELKGKLNQTITADDPLCDRVEAIPAPGYRFTYWSDGSTNPIRVGESFSKDTLLTAYFRQDILNLPAVSLNTDIPPSRIDTERYVGGSISISGCEEEYALTDFDTEVRGRGHGSWTYDKKGWKLKLSEGQSLLGLGKGKSREWVLIANQVDRSLLRNAAATWIQHRLELDWVPDYAFVDLYLNGEYMGVYQLCEQIEEDEHKVSVLPGTVEDVSYLVELTVHAGDPRFTVHSKPYEVQSKLPEENPQEYLNAIDAHLTACMVAVKSGDFEEINALIDLDSLVNAYIVEELTKNRDAGWDSFYLYRNPGGKLTFGPLWDFDMSSGNVKADEGSVCHHTFSFPDGLYVGNLQAKNDKQQNVWFMEFAQYDWFWERVEIRWEQVSPALSALPSLLYATRDRYEEAFERNFQRWDILRKKLSTEANVILTMDSCSQQIAYLADWYRQRIEWLDGVWGEG